MLTANHFPICISRGGTWLGFEWAITRTEALLLYDDEHAQLNFQQAGGINPDRRGVKTSC